MSATAADRQNLAGPGAVQDWLHASVARRLARLHAATFPGAPTAHGALIHGTAGPVLALQAGSDALYHSAEHTMLVTLAGEGLMRGARSLGRVDATDCLHMTLALLIHDVGFARGACAGDSAQYVVIGPGGMTAVPPRGASDAWLGPHHVTRSMIHAQEVVFAASPIVDAERVARNVAATRFPPDAIDPPEAEGALVRAADLIGQLGDPRCLVTATALHHEVAETGQAEAPGHASAADIVKGLARFYRDRVEPLIRPALEMLALTAEGRVWLDGLRDNLAAAASATRMRGPWPGPSV